MHRKAKVFLILYNTNAKYEIRYRSLYQSIDAIIKWTNF